MQIPFTIDQKYPENLISSLKDIQDYKKKGDPKLLKNAMLLGAFAVESGIQIIAKEIFGINIFSKNKKMTKKIKDIRNEIDVILKESGMDIINDPPSFTYYNSCYEILNTHFDKIIDLRNDLAHREGEFDDNMAIENLIVMLNFINMLIPRNYRMDVILEDEHLKNFFIKLTQDCSSVEFVTMLRELIANNYKEARYLPTELELCDQCNNISISIFSDNHKTTNICLLCAYHKSLFECLRCGNHFDIQDKSTTEIDSDADAYLCGWCFDDYMSKN